MRTLQHRKRNHIQNTPQSTFLYNANSALVVVDFRKLIKHSLYEGYRNAGNDKKVFQNHFRFF